MESHKIEIKEGVTGYLQQTFGYKSGKLIELCGSEILIGRNRNAEIKLFSPNVSRNHCSLHYTKDGWTIVDNSSFNGVYINTKQLKPNVPYLLKHGHRIFFGPPEDNPQSFTYLCPAERINLLSATIDKDVSDQLNNVAIKTLENCIPQKLSCLEILTPSRETIINNSVCTKLIEKKKVDDCNTSCSQKRVSDSDDTLQKKKIKGNLIENPELEPTSVGNNDDVINVCTPNTASPTLKECMEVVDRRLKKSAKIEARVRRVLLKSEECLSQCRSQDTNCKDKAVSDQLNNTAITTLENCIPQKKKKIKGNLIENPELETASVSNNDDVINVCTPNTASPTLKECLEVVDRRLKESDKIGAQVRRVLLKSDECLSECRSQDTNCKHEVSDDENSESLLTTADDFFIGSDPYPFSQHLDDYPSTSLQEGCVSPISVTISNDNKNDPKQNLEERFAKLQEELDEKNQLQLELEKALSEKNELLKNQETMKKDKECLKSELEDAKSYQQSMKDEVTAQFGDLMEAEFTCGICTELFVKAVTLDCSHTFCEKCITEWKKKKKQCPICRAKTNEGTRSLVIDNFIEKMVGKLSIEYQERRKSVVKDRLQYQSKKPVQSKKKTKRTRRRQDPVEVVANSEPEDSDDLLTLHELLNITDSESSVEGDEFGYYGGYGRCFNCGHRGHWANGCPESY